MMHFMVIGGPIMWGLLLMGVVALIVYLERTLHLHRARISWEDFLRGIFNVIERDNIDEALSICDDTPGPVAHLARTAILNRDRDAAVLQQALQSAGESEIARMRRRFTVIATTAQVAPLLGLLGTIFKMVDGLMHIQQQTPIVQRMDVLDPLMQALLLTAGGLTVAIPCYLGYSLLVVKVERLVVEMQAASAEIMATMIRGGRDTTNAQSGES
ncbi:MAG: MotA/TolQ/ExbB proton channel family protein [Verrucomicrobia bacterium]|nr:MotA/TolQ/ExbB proton channel family protein [Verrucomicrobiota bacterium]MDA1086740.1 MotA/TolQ/ExbB proton channel family protein [Verrucomicrobiota bacterium]